jgi:hypothetical protein
MFKIILPFLALCIVAVSVICGVLAIALTQDLINGKINADTNTTTSADVQGQTCCNVCGTGEDE